MAVTVLTPASTRLLTTLDALEDDLGTAEVQTRAPYFLRLIARASSAIERFCGGRIFAQQRYRETLEPVYGPQLLLTHRPLVSVASVLGGEDTLTGWHIDEYGAGILRHAYGWGYRHALVAWSTATVALFRWTVEYVAGFILPGQITPPEPTGPSLPGEIEQAALEACKVWHTERLPEKRIVSRHWEDQTISYSVQAGRSGLPKLSQELLLDSGWRRLAVR